jgi:hypothetical protein
MVSHFTGIKNLNVSWDNELQKYNWRSLDSNPQTNVNGVIEKSTKGGWIIYSNYEKTSNIEYFIEENLMNAATKVIEISRLESKYEFELISKEDFKNQLIQTIAEFRVIETSIVSNTLKLLSYDFYKELSMHFYDLVTNLLYDKGEFIEIEDFSDIEEDSNSTEVYTLEELADNFSDYASHEHEIPYGHSFILENTENVITETGTYFINLN